jgi:hypothetical protein
VNAAICLTGIRLVDQVNRAIWVLYHFKLRLSATDWQLEVRLGKARGEHNESGVPQKAEVSEHSATSESGQKRKSPSCSLRCAQVSSANRSVVGEGESGTLALPILTARLRRRSKTNSRQPCAPYVVVRFAQ